MNVPDELPPRPTLPSREPDSHKGDYGRALLVGGSRGMSGAIGLAGMATLRSGAGLVKLAVPDVCLDVVATFEPSYMTVPLVADAAGRIAAGAKPVLAELLDVATAVAIGPGLGRSADLDALVAWLYQEMRQPAVFDADALNALSADPEVLSNPGGPRILTPHPGEFARLIGGAQLDGDARTRRAVELAQTTGAIVVVKGHQTLITDGQQSATNTTGNPGMATGGSGDVLTGVIVGLLCHGLAPFAAAQLGCHIHGLAGDVAADELGQVSMIAADLVEFLPEAFEMITDA